MYLRNKTQVARNAYNDNQNKDNNKPVSLNDGPIRWLQREFNRATCLSLLGEPVYVPEQ